MAAVSAHTAATLSRPDSGQMGVDEPGHLHRGVAGGAPGVDHDVGHLEDALPGGVPRGDAAREGDRRDRHDGAVRSRARRARARRGRAPSPSSLTSQRTSPPARRRGPRPCGRAPRRRTRTLWRRPFPSRPGGSRCSRFQATSMPWRPTRPPARSMGSRAVWPVSKWWIAPPAATRAAVSSAAAESAAPEPARKRSRWSRAASKNRSARPLTRARRPCPSAAPRGAPGRGRRPRSSGTSSRTPVRRTFTSALPSTTCLPMVTWTG